MVPPDRSRRCREQRAAALLRMAEGCRLLHIFRQQALTALILAAAECTRICFRVWTRLSSLMSCGNRTWSRWPG